MIRGRWSFLLETRVERPSSLSMSSRCGGPSMFSVAGIVEEGLQPGSLGLGAPRPDNVTVVKERENVRVKERRRGWGRNRQRRRRRLRLWNTLAQTMLMWSDHVSVSLMVTPRNLKERTCSTWLPSTLSSRVLPVAFLLEWMRILFAFKVFNLKPFLWSHRFARLRQIWIEDCRWL